ncbi:MAG: manganese efflux pump MntP [Gemmatimonadaceae bacterium]
MVATIALFLSLGLDTLAVALGLGVSGLPRQRWIRVGLTFAFFEGIMPVAGLLVGQHVSGVLGEIAGYAAGVLLLGLGGWEIRDALTDDDLDAANASAGQAKRQDRSILLTGLSVSLDELAVGFSLGVLGVAVGPALMYIALQAFALTFLGLWLGTRVGAKLGERAELTAGIILALLGAALIVGEVTGTHFL